MVSKSNITLVIEWCQHLVCPLIGACPIFGQLMIFNYPRGVASLPLILIGTTRTEVIPLRENG